MSSTTNITVSNNSKRDDECELMKKKMDQAVLNCGRERLKMHHADVAGRVWIPDIWGQEDLLKDWIDCPVFDASLAPKGFMSAREALAQEQKSRRRATSCSSGLELGTTSC